MGFTVSPIRKGHQNLYLFTSKIYLHLTMRFWTARYKTIVFEKLNIFAQIF